MARHNKIKLTQEYHTLDSVGKVLYHTGMPSRFIKGEPKQLHFKNEALPSGKLMSDQVQAAYYNEYLKAPPRDQGFTVFCSTSTDNDAFEAVTKLLKKYVTEDKFADFEFIHPTETIPQDPEDRASLYIMTGVNQTDPMIMPHVRRWITYPTGSQIWVVLSSPKPFSWCVDQLGRKPDALFSLAAATIFVG